MPAPPYSLGRLTVLSLVLLVGLQVAQGARPLVMATLLAVAAAAGIAAAVGPLSGWYSSGRFADSLLWARGVVLVGVAGVLAQFLVSADVQVPVHASVLVAGVGLTLVFVMRAGTALGTIAYWLLLAGYTSMMLVLFSDLGPLIEIDVRNYLEDGSRDIADGVSPYGGSVENPHSEEGTERFFHPDLVEGDRILIGYPYLPGILMADVLGYLMGDVRYVHLFALLGSTLLLRGLARDATGHVLALAPIASPLSVKVLLAYWVEPVVILMLVLVAVAVHDKRRGLGVVGVALLLLSKQYFAAVLPFLLVVRRSLGLRPVVAAAGLVSLVLLGFILWDPSGFWHDVVVVQLKQPFRPDSISLTTALWQDGSEPPRWVTGSLPLVAGLLVSGLISLRLSPDACAAMLSVGLGLLVTVLLSKQAFPNYYALVQAALVVAVVTWPPNGLGRAAPQPLGLRAADT